MRWLKKIIVIITSLFVFILVLNWGVSYYITKKLPSIINDEKDFPYNISYKDLDISLLNGSFVIHEASIAPKDSAANVMQQGVFGQIKTVEVQHFNLWALLRNNKIRVKKIIIDTPEIILYDREKKYNVEDDVVKPFKNSITTGSLQIRNGNFTMLDTTQHISLKASKIGLELYNIKVDSATVGENIPVRYTDYHFKCDSLFYRAGDVYNITAQHLANTDSTMTLQNFKLIPKYNRVNFTKSLTKEKDLFAITVKKINIPWVNWGFINNVLYVHTPKLILDNAHANIYRNKLPPDDPSEKAMYSQLLRSIKFDLKADKVLLKNSLIEYEEQIDFTKPAAKVTFANFYATISNAYSPVNKKKLPATTIDAQCMFMKSTPLKVLWTFNSLNAKDAFTIKGSLQDIKSQELDKITKPLMNATTTGLLKEVRFSFNGNKDAATGTFAMDYDDFKVTVFQKDGKKKRKFLSAIGNLFIKNDSNEQLKATEIEGIRNKQKSFFNFLWTCLMDGLKKTLLPKAVAEVLPKPKSKNSK
jgi:hypothetical protein